MDKKNIGWINYFLRWLQTNELVSGMPERDKNFSSFRRRILDYFDNIIFNKNTQKINFSAFYSLIKKDDIFVLKIKRRPYYHYLLKEFLTRIHGVPLNGFKKCPECDNWFLHVTRKKKVYCSNKCAARYGVRRIRNTNKK